MKPGYQIQVTSWENDCDNYNTKIISGLTEDEARFLVFIARAFDDRPNEHVSGNDENNLVGFLRLYLGALDVSNPFPRYGFDEFVPTEEQMELLDEYLELGYNCEREKDPKWFLFSKDINHPAKRFANYFTETTSMLLGNPGESYYDEKNFVRKCESVTVLYIPGTIVDVTNKFVTS